MLLDVRSFDRSSFPPLIVMTFVLLAGAAIALATKVSSHAQQSPPSPPSAPAQPSPGSPAGQSAGTGAQGAAAGGQIPRDGLSIVVLDPAHGGTDTGARGGGGIRESEIVLDFAG